MDNKRKSYDNSRSSGFKQKVVAQGIKIAYNSSTSWRKDGGGEGSLNNNISVKFSKRSKSKGVNTFMGHLGQSLMQQRLDKALSHEDFFQTVKRSNHETELLNDHRYQIDGANDKPDGDLQRKRGTTTDLQLTKHQLNNSKNQHRSQKGGLQLTSPTMNGGGQQVYGSSSVSKNAVPPNHKYKARVTTLVDMLKMNRQVVTAQHSEKRRIQQRKKSVVATSETEQYNINPQIQVNSQPMRISLFFKQPMAHPTDGGKKQTMSKTTESDKEVQYSTPASFEKLTTSQVDLLKNTVNTAVSKKTFKKASEKADRGENTTEYNADGSEAKPISEKDIYKLRYEWANNKLNKPVISLQDFDPSHRIQSYQEQIIRENRKKHLNQRLPSNIPEDSRDSVLSEFDEQGLTMLSARASNLTSGKKISQNWTKLKLGDNLALRDFIESIDTNHSGGPEPKYKQYYFESHSNLHPSTSQTFEIRDQLMQLLRDQGQPDLWKSIEKSVKYTSRGKVVSDAKYKEASLSPKIIDQNVTHVKQKVIEPYNKLSRYQTFNKLPIRSQHQMMQLKTKESSAEDDLYNNKQTLTKKSTLEQDDSVLEDNRQYQNLQTQTRFHDQMPSPAFKTLKMNDSFMRSTRGLLPSHSGNVMSKKKLSGVDGNQNNNLLRDPDPKLKSVRTSKNTKGEIIKEVVTQPISTFNSTSKNFEEADDDSTPAETKQVDKGANDLDQFKITSSQNILQVKDTNANDNLGAGEIYFEGRQAPKVQMSKTTYTPADKYLLNQRAPTDEDLTSYKISKELVKTYYEDSSLKDKTNKHYAKGQPQNSLKSFSQSTLRIANIATLNTNQTSISFGRQRAGDPDSTTPNKFKWSNMDEMDQIYQCLVSQRQKKTLQAKNILFDKNRKIPRTVQKVNFQKKVSKLNSHRETNAQLHVAEGKTNGVGAYGTAHQSHQPGGGILLVNSQLDTSGSLHGGNQSTGIQIIDGQTRLVNLTQDMNQASRAEYGIHKAQGTTFDTFTFDEGNGQEDGMFHVRHEEGNAAGGQGGQPLVKQEYQLQTPSLSRHDYQLMHTPALSVAQVEGPTMPRINEPHVHEHQPILVDMKENAKFGQESPPRQGMMKYGNNQQQYHKRNQIQYQNMDLYDQDRNETTHRQTAAQHHSVETLPRLHQDARDQPLNTNLDIDSHDILHHNHLKIPLPNQNDTQHSHSITISDEEEFNGEQTQFLEETIKQVQKSQVITSKGTSLRASNAGVSFTLTTPTRPVDHHFKKNHNDNKSSNENSLPMLPKIRKSLLKQQKYSKQNDKVAIDAMALDTYHQEERQNRWAAAGDVSNKQDYMADKDANNGITNNGNSNSNLQPNKNTDRTKLVSKSRLKTEMGGSSSSMQSAQLLKKSSANASSLYLILPQTNHNQGLINVGSHLNTSSNKKQHVRSNNQRQHQLQFPHRQNHSQEIESARNGSGDSFKMPVITNSHHMNQQEDESADDAYIMGSNNNVYMRTKTTRPIEKFNIKLSDYRKQIETSADGLRKKPVIKPNFSRLNQKIKEQYQSSRHLVQGNNTITIDFNTVDKKMNKHYDSNRAMTRTTSYKRKNLLELQKTAIQGKQFESHYGMPIIQQQQNLTQHSFGFQSKLTKGLSSKQTDRTKVCNSNKPGSITDPHAVTFFNKFNESVVKGFMNNGSQKEQEDLYLPRDSPEKNKKSNNTYHHFGYELKVNTPENIDGHVSGLLSSSNHDLSHIQFLNESSDQGVGRNQNLQTHLQLNQSGSSMKIESHNLDMTSPESYKFYQMMNTDQITTEMTSIQDKATGINQKKEKGDRLSSLASIEKPSTNIHIHNQSWILRDESRKNQKASSRLETITLEKQFRMTQNGNSLDGTIEDAVMGSQYQQQLAADRQQHSSDQENSPYRDENNQQARCSSYDSQQDDKSSQITQTIKVMIPNKQDQLYQSINTKQSSIDHEK